jgi:hypothetical protein
MTPRVRLRPAREERPKLAVAEVHSYASPGTPLAPTFSPPPQDPVQALNLTPMKMPMSGRRNPVGSSSINTMT